jgi:hypothetical protein
VTYKNGRNVRGVAGIIFEDKIKLRETISVTHTPESGKYVVAKKYEAYVKEDIIDGLDSSKLSDCSEEIQAIVRSLDFNGTTFKSKANLAVIKDKIKRLPSILSSRGLGVEFIKFWH